MRALRDEIPTCGVSGGTRFCWGEWGVAPRVPCEFKPPKKPARSPSCTFGHFLLNQALREPRELGDAVSVSSRTRFRARAAATPPTWPTVASGPKPPLWGPRGGRRRVPLPPISASQPAALCFSGGEPRPRARRAPQDVGALRQRRGRAAGSVSRSASASGTDLRK